MARPNSRPGRSCKTMDETMAVVDEPGTRVPRLYRRWECVNKWLGFPLIRSTRGIVSPRRPRRASPLFPASGRETATAG